jgi:hypothetical protein
MTDCPAFCPEPSPERSVLPPRPTLSRNRSRTDLKRFAVNWQNSGEAGLLVPSPVGVWTPWSLASLAPKPISIYDREPTPADCLGRPYGAQTAGFCWFWSHFSEQWMFHAVLVPDVRGNLQLRIPGKLILWFPHWAMPFPDPSLMVEFDE